MSKNLATQFDLSAESATLNAQIAERKQEFTQAISSGGSPADYKTWRASLTALEAALEILRDARPPNSPLNRTDDTGEKKWI